MARRLYTSRQHPAMRQGFNASCLQIRRAYLAHFGTDMPEDKTYQSAANLILSSMGRERGQEFILAQSNDPSAE
jgi:hypothetical protein